MSSSSPRVGAPPLVYTVRSSARAKRVTLRVLAGQGLVVSVPRRFARRDVPAVVEAHRAWAEAALADLARRTPEVCRVWPPEVLELAAVSRRIVLRWRDAAPASPSGAGAGTLSRMVAGTVPAALLGTAFGTDSRGAVTAVSGVSGTTVPERAAPSGGARWSGDDTLELAVTPDDRVGVATAVVAALREEGRRVLVPRLCELAERHALPYARVAVRAQRSVWGSCSSRGTVSLNCKLLFLRSELVDYVLLHELAHTRHLDHSAAFWRLLAALEPAARALDRELRSAGRLVPPWLELARSAASNGA